jgi:hypothetical protein
MAFPPLDPYGQLPPQVNPAVDWSTVGGVPASWSHVPQDPNEIQMPPMDARAPGEIEMPAEDARAHVGFPVDPGPPTIEQPPMVDAPPMQGQAPPPERPATMLQPGIGLPASALDNALPPFPMQADAVSGVNANAYAVPGDVNVVHTPDMSAHPLTPEQRGAQYAAGSPFEQFKTDRVWADAYKKEEDKRKADVALQDEQRAFEIHSALRKAREEARATTLKLDAESSAEAEKPIVTTWQAEGMQRLAGIAAAMVSGLVQSRQGGPNVGLDIIKQQIANDIDAQKTMKQAKLQDIARRGASNEKLLALAGDEAEDAERYRQTTLKRLEKQVETEMGNFDPSGKQAIEYGKFLVALRTERAKSAMAFEDKRWTDHKDALAFASAQQKANDEHEESLLKQAKAKGVLGGGGAKATDPQDIVHAPGDFAALDMGPVPPVAMSFNGYKTWLTTKKLGAEVTGGASTLSKEQIEHAVPSVKTIDGKPYLANGPPDNAVRLSKQVAATKTLVRLMDEVLAMRTGWTSDTVKSPEWQALKANWAAATGVAKDVLGLGALSGPDMQLVEQFLGASDPTRVIGIETGVKKARENIMNLTNDALNESSLNGKVKFDIPYIAPAKPKPTANDAKQKAALSRPSTADVVNKAKDTEADVIPDAMLGKQPVQPRAVEDVAGDYEKNALAHVQDLTSTLESGSDADRAKAEAMLGELSASPQASASVRAAAQAALISHQVTQDSGVAGPIRSVAYEEAPPRPAAQPNKPKKKARK